MSHAASEQNVLAQGYADRLHDLLLRNALAEVMQHVSPTKKDGSLGEVIEFRSAAWKVMEAAFPD